MTDFGALPPEVISGLLYAGPGPGSLIQAGFTWTSIAEGLENDALDMRAVMMGLGAVWQGHSSQTALASVRQYLQWMESTADAARRSASAALGATSAYEQALAAVVPVPVIAANRAQLLMLVASNLLGQNTSAIAALETQYEQMWAQDTAVMTTYQADSNASMAQLPTFSPAPQVATPLTQTNTAAAPAQTTLLQFLQQLFPGITAGDPLGNLADVLLSPLGIAFVSSGELAVDPLGLLGSFIGLISLGTAATAQGAANAAMGAANSAIASRAPSMSVNTPPAAEVKAAAAAGNRIGPMRVPPSWAQPQQQSSAAEPFTPTGGKSDKRDIPVGIPVIPAVPVTGGKAGKKKGTQFEDMDYGEPVPPILNRHPSGG